MKTEYSRWKRGRRDDRQGDPPKCHKGSKLLHPVVHLHIFYNTLKIIVFS